MVDQGDDDSFLEDFLQRAKQREAKLAQITKQIEAHNAGSDGSSTTTTTTTTSTHQTKTTGPITKPKDDVTYPPLSPLEEEGDVEPSECQDDDEMSYDVENKAENDSIEDGELNYSSDLSIACEQDDSDIYRAKLVYANSGSPEHKPSQATSVPFSQISPRKRAHSSLQPINNQHQQQYHMQVQHQPKTFISSSSTTSTCSSSKEHTQDSENNHEQKATSSQSLPEMSDIEQSIKSLQLKVESAESRRGQLKKILELSKYGSAEHIEAAMKLQIAEIEHLNYTNYMAMFKQGLRKKTESLGSIIISTIRLKISPKLRNDLAEDSVSHYFFCIASCGTVVKATKIMDTNDIKRQDLKAYIHFNEELRFVGLAPDFIIKIEVFELVTRTSQALTHTKILQAFTPTKKTKITLDKHFKRVGSLKLTLADREITYKNLVQWSEAEKSKYIERECKFELELKPEQLPSKAGMLHIRCIDNSGRPDWTRFWVDLSRAQIRYWKSKQDALDDKKPNQVLEIKDICCEQVEILTPDDDLYRKNSFIFHTYQQVTAGDTDNLFQRILKNETKFKIVKHQLAAENKEERDFWFSILNKSINCFREWHGRSKIYTDDEIREIFY